MRRFHSYGPVDPSSHFCVERRELVERCVQQLIGDPDKGGDYFTVWGPRQTGKTWIMRRAIAEIRARYGERFAAGALSMEGLLSEDDPEEALLKFVPTMFREGLAFEPPTPRDWDDWLRLFARQGGAFDQPLILLIDEFDSLPPRVLDHLVRLFRRIYLGRDSYALHGLALLGVRAVLGLDSPRGSPFNIQRSLHVPNLTTDEVIELFGQYQAESGQLVEPEVVDKVFEVTRGQPGLVSWFGELCTEKYNPGREHPITLKTWDQVYAAACQIEPNNTVLNIIKKARGEYREHVMGLFSRPDVPFAFDQDWCNYLYLNGIIHPHEGTDMAGQPTRLCRFSSPFIQLRLYNALTYDLFDPLLPTLLLPLEPLDTLSDVFSAAGLDVPALLQRYRGYLARLKAKGVDPWKGQPRRQDLRLPEAVGHFHLYAWLRDAVGRRCVVSPEFPTGNGKVDLLLRWEDKTGVIEVKSFREAHEMPGARQQAARYAKSQGLSSATLAVFVPTEDETVLEGLSVEEVLDGVRVITVAIGWS
jgi:hypothetical protein